MNVGFTLRVPDSENLASNFHKARIAASEAKFSGLELPALFRSKLKLRDLGDLSKAGSIHPEVIAYRPEVTDTEHLLKIDRLLSRLSPDYALIVDRSSANNKIAAGEIIQAILNRPSETKKPRFWAECDLSSSGLSEIQRKVRLGFSGFTAPYTFLSSFDRSLASFHSLGLGEAGSIVVGLPYIQCKKDLENWLKTTKINPAEHSEIQVTLELWDRAERDGDLEKFGRFWNEAQIAHLTSNVGICGVRFMPNTVNLDSMQTFARAVAPATIPVNPMVFNSSRSSWAKFTTDMESLGIAVNADAIIFSELGLPDKSPYSKQCLPLLSAIVEVFTDCKLLNPDSKMFNGMSLRLQRRTMLSTASAAVTVASIYPDNASYLNGAKSENTEVTVNLLPLLKLSPEGFKQELSRYLGSYVRQGSGPDPRVELRTNIGGHCIDGDKDSALFSLGSQGYAYLVQIANTNLITAEGAFLKHGTGGLFPSAEQDKFVKICADQIETALLKSKTDNPVYIEPGSYEAHGIDLLIEELAKRSDYNPELKDGLRTLTFVFSDFKAEALRTCSEKLGECDLTTGIKFEYITLDSTQSPEATYKQKGLSERIIVGRAINVLESVGTDFVAKINGQFCTVAAKTYLNLKTLSDLLFKKWQDHHELHKGRFSFNDEGVSVGAIEEILNQLPRDTAVATLLNYLQNELGIPEHRALFLWRKIYETCLEQERDYIQTSMEDYNWSQAGVAKKAVDKVLSSHPGNFIISDSLRAVGVLDGILSAMNSGSSFVVLSPTTDINAGRADYHLDRIYGLTPATPVTFDILSAWAQASAYSCDRILGSNLGLKDTNSCLIFTKLP